MGFKGMKTIKNVHIFKPKKEEKQNLSSSHFRLVKLSLDRLLLSRACLCFALQGKSIN
jgi:hypothetical protein